MMTIQHTPKIYRTVYVTQRDKSKDMSDLSRFAKDRVDVFSRPVYPDEADTRSVTITKDAAVVLRDFDPEQDAIALSGCPVLMAVCVGVLAQKNAKISVLKWDRKYDGYYETVLDFRIGEAHGQQIGGYPC